MKRTIRNTRARKNVGQALPNSSLVLDIPLEFTTTNKGDLFLIYDSGPTNARILIFVTKKNLDILVQLEHWYADGTFKTVPSIFGQLYTIHGVKSGIIMPLVYALLPNKTEETYKKFLVALKEKIPTFQPLTIMIDFELAMVKAIEQEFPRSQICGCFFIFVRAFIEKYMEVD
ncbi:uncharacterized protein [Palaemon carinicauda]|uniref:uncharacterized protein n=1 Tax=Palaemon carinicauda TaxID=392227 RepID=UPI0035B60B39